MTLTLTARWNGTLSSQMAGEPPAPIDTAVHVPDTPGGHLELTRLLLSYFTRRLDPELQLAAPKAQLHPQWIIAPELLRHHPDSLLRTVSHAGMFQHTVCVLPAFGPILTSLLREAEQQLGAQFIPDQIEQAYPLAPLTQRHPNLGPARVAAYTVTRSGVPVSLTAPPQERRAGPARWPSRWTADSGPFGQRPAL